MEFKEKTKTECPHCLQDLIYKDYELSKHKCLAGNPGSCECCQTELWDLKFYVSGDRSRINWFCKFCSSSFASLFVHNPIIPNDTQKIIQVMAQLSWLIVEELESRLNPDKDYKATGKKKTE